MAARRTMVHPPLPLCGCSFSFLHQGKILRAAAWRAIHLAEMIRDRLKTTKTMLLQYRCVFFHTRRRKGQGRLFWSDAFALCCMCTLTIFLNDAFFHASIHSSQPPPCTQVQTELFEEKDQDNDGLLDTSEFRSMLLEDVHPDEVRSLFVCVVSAVAVSKPLYLSLPSFEQRMGEPAVKKIFLQADMDNDKKVLRARACTCV